VAQFAPGEAEMALTFYTTSEAANALGLSWSGVRVLVRRGDLPLYATSKRGVFLFEPSAVELVRRQRAAAKAEKREAAR
jgi:excisionase family DNA binding protein